jgi:hypothetical protein
MLDVHRSVFDGTDALAVFMGCRWHELFDQYTPDTYHPKLFSLSSLVTEAVEIGNLHDSHEAWAKHLKKVQSEIAERIDRGFEKRMCTPRQLGMLGRMSKADQPSEVEGIGRVLELEEFPYHLERKSLEHLRSRGADDLRAGLAETDALLTSLATQAFRKGHTAADHAEVLERISLGVDSVREWIASSIPDGKEQFDCVIAVEAPSHEVHAGIRKVCDSAGVRQASPKLAGLSEPGGVIFLRGEASGFRAEDALESLKSDVRASLNLLALYRQQLAPEIRSGGWVLVDGKARFTADRKPSFLNLHPRKRADELANRAADALAKSKGEPAIRAALDLHNMAVSMTDDGLRLVNLWAALECLASVVPGKSIISRVERLVVPIITWRKIDKIVRYLAISIHFWLKKNPEMERGNLPFPLSRSGSVAPERILTLLCQPAGSEKLRALLEMVDGHPLLRYRIDNAWKLFHDPRKLLSDLKSSESRLAWHLWRIYRARNLLVHQGRRPECLPQLANHLQQYLSWTMSRVLHGIAMGGAWTARDSWMFWTSKAEHVRQSLERQPGGLTVGDLFPEELREPDFPVWPVIPSGRESAPAKP